MPADVDHQLQGGVAVLGGLAPRAALIVHGRRRRLPLPPFFPLSLPPSLRAFRLPPRGAAAKGARRAPSAALRVPPRRGDPAQPGPARSAPHPSRPGPPPGRASRRRGGPGRPGRAGTSRPGQHLPGGGGESGGGGGRLSRPERSGCYGERGPLPLNEYSRGGRCGPVAPSRASPARERCRTSPRVTTAAPPHTQRVLILALSGRGKALRGGAGEGGAAAAAATTASSSRRPRGRPCGGTPRSRWRWGGERERGRLIDGYPGDAGAPAPPARRSQWAGAAGPAGCGAI